MPRGGGRSSSRSPGRSSFASSRPATQAPKPAQSAPTQSSGGMFGGLGSTLMTGMAFGAGSAVAHQAVRGVMGGSGSSHDQIEQAPQQSGQYQTQQQNPCQFQITNFTQCLQNNKDIGFCQRYSDILKSCQQSQPQ